MVGSPISPGASPSARFCSARFDSAPIQGSVMPNGFGSSPYCWNRFALEKRVTVSRDQEVSNPTLMLCDPVT